MLQSAVYIRLKSSVKSPHRQIWEETDSLPAGETVVINAGSVLPLDTGDYLWFRNDLNYVVTGTFLATTLWQAYLSKLEEVA